MNYWKCRLCEKVFGDNAEDVVLVYRCFLSNQTPVLGRADVYCADCYSDADLILGRRASNEAGRE